MLWFIGLGISGISELSDSTLSLIKNADIVYLESFTSPISEAEKDQLNEISFTAVNLSNCFTRELTSIAFITIIDS